MLWIAVLLAALPAGAAAQQRVALSEPAPAPDRRELAFVSGGDIWRVSSRGGEASLLVSHPADESRPLYSPDGKHLAFVSTRTGGGDIYLLTLATGELRRITFTDTPEQLDAWSHDSQWIYFHSTSGDIAGMSDVFRVRAAGGTPMPAAADRYANEFFAAPSPDGKTLALNARGVANRQWWRKGHSNLDRSEIWFVRPGPKPSYTKMTDGAAKEIWPMWHPDGKSFFFVSDRGGAENLWRQPVGGTSRQLSQFKDGRVLWPSIAGDGKTIYFERDFAIWKMETGNGKASLVEITLRGSPAAPALQHLSLTNGFSNLALSPDGKKLAFLARGEIFAAPSAMDGNAGETVRVTRTGAAENGVAWSPDSSKLVYASDRKGSNQLFLYDFAARSETQLTSSTESDAAPVFSPDGKSVAFLRAGKGVWLYDLEAKQERQLAQAEVERHPLIPAKPLAWSPDGAWIAYAARGPKGFRNVHLIEAKGGTSHQVSYLSNAFINAVTWSRDGRYLLFDTGQRTEQSRIARVDLSAAQPRVREDQFRELFQQGAKPESTPAVKFEPEGIRRRIQLLPVRADVSDLAVSKDGKTLLITAESAGQQNVFTWPLDELVEKPALKQLTSTAASKADAQFTPDGKQVYLLEEGKVQVVTVESRAAKALALKAELDVDFHQEKQEVFRQAWSYERDHFFDEQFNGVDWASLRAAYEPLVNGARTAPELYRLLNLMMGELNASHLGVSPPAREDRATGRVGLRFDTDAYETRGQFVVNEVIPLSPAALAGVKAGETLFAVNGVKLTAQTNLDELLDRTIGKRVELMAGAAQTEARTVVARPIAISEEKELLYRAWVEERREYVEKASTGRLGYVHMPNMSAEALNRLYVDLDTENHNREGVVIDLRNNSGGFVNAYALDVFARRPYLTFQERGRASAPARSVLGQRALELPTILVVNQHSLSDAEDFTEGYRRLRLGKVVGLPTAGWIVYTWNQKLIDGSTVRLPRVKVFDNDGQLMEMHPRPVDFPVERPIGESYTGRDTQLDTAVRELLEDAGQARTRASQ
jgi:Tol biopolymer transport system component/C-terminal processing protease CtpA/Prc